MLKQRHPSFMPQTMADEQRRVGGHCKQRRRDHLRQVIKPGELCRSDLQMNLEATAAGFEHQIVMRDMKLVESLDVNVESAATQLMQRAIQFVVAWEWGQIVERQVGLPDRW